jgi:hypothetical protein
MKIRRRAREAGGSAVAHLRGLNLFYASLPGLAPQALCCHLLRRFSAHAFATPASQAKSVEATLSNLTAS